MYTSSPCGRKIKPILRNGIGYYLLQTTYYLLRSRPNGTILYFLVVNSYIIIILALSNHYDFNILINIML